MKKSNIIFALIFSLVCFIAGYILINNYKLGLCYSNISTNTFDVSCNDQLRDIGLPLYFGMFALAFVFLILLFIPRVIPAWKKFAKWFIPIAALVFIFYKGPGAGDYFSPYPEQIYRWISALYVIISLFFIVNISKKKVTK